MLKTAVAVLVSAALMFSAPAFAVDGQVLINQATVMAMGGFPYNITQPGSYKLSGNLVVTGTDGIDVHTNNVTIDLNGFAISGPVTCFGSGSGIGCGPLVSPAGIRGLNVSGITIRNGTITGLNNGIFIYNSSNILVEDIHAGGNQTAGIQVQDAVVRRNTTSLNGQFGIVASNSLVTENVSNFNGGRGLFMDGGLYGSNTMQGNSNPPFFTLYAISQNNNNCEGTIC
jgi:hypothetical protein